jgi:hypothetical protein
MFDTYFKFWIKDISIEDSKTRTVGKVVVPWVKLVFLSSVWRKLHVVKFEMLYARAHVSGNGGEFLFQHCFIYVDSDDIYRREDEVTQNTTGGCTLSYPMLHLMTEFKKR